MNEKNQKLTHILFLLRIGVAIVFIMWTGNKFINPINAQEVWSGFFYLPELGMAVTLGIAIAEAILVTMFVLGILKNISYLIVLILHSFSTFAAYDIYLNAYAGGPNLLFFAAFPMLAACYAVYSLRDYDTFLTVKL